MKQIMLIFILVLFQGSLQAADIPEIVLDSEKSSADECVYQKTQDCIRQCSASEERDCPNQCQASAEEDCEELSE